MFKLMVVTDRTRAKMPLPELVRRAIDGGADAIQMRERDLPGGELMRLGRELRQVTRDAGAALIVNHRADLAVALEADGLHLGWRSVGVPEARQICGDKMRIGVSCHDGGQLRFAEEAGADYVLLGPVFPTPSKEGLVEALGMEKFRELVKAARLPIVGVGGITPENFRDALDAGAAGVAVISAIMDADDPAAAARSLRT